MDMDMCRYSTLFFPFYRLEFSCHNRRHWRSTWRGTCNTLTGWPARLPRHLSVGDCDCGATGTMELGKLELALVLDLLLKLGTACWHLWRIATAARM